MRRQRMLHRAWGVIGLSCCCVMTVGCGSRESRVPTFAAAGQVVTTEGVPVPHALIVLHAIEGQAESPRPRGTTDAEGRFQLTTYDTHDGAPAGEFVVTIEQWIRDNPNQPAKNHLPENLAKRDASGIRLSIAKGANVLEPILVR